MKTVFAAGINIPEDVIQDFIDTIQESIEALEALAAAEHKLRIFAHLGKTLKGFEGDSAGAVTAKLIMDTFDLPHGRHMRENDMRTAITRLKQDFDLAVNLLDIEFPFTLSYESELIGQQPIDLAELAQEQAKQTLPAGKGVGDDIPF